MENTYDKGLHTSEVHLNATKKNIYTYEEIQSCKLNDHSYVKPLQIVKIWRRRLVYTNNRKESPPRPRRESYRAVQHRVGQVRAKEILSKAKLDANNAKIISTLNKLTPVNIAKLQPELFDLGSTSEETLNKLVEKIFQKACYEKKYTEMWASLCLYLSQRFRTSQDPHSQVSKSSNKFKTCLLNMSQFLFEDFENSSESVETQKNKIMGNMKFIGELFKFSVIPPKTITRCILSLLNFDQSANFNEKKIEAATVLIMSCGTKYQKLGESFNEIMEKIQYLNQDQKISPRIKFLLLVKFT